MPARRGSANRACSRNHLRTAVSCSSRLQGRDGALVPLRLCAWKIQRLTNRGGRTCPGFITGTTMTSKRGSRAPTENVADHVSSPVLDACVALPDKAT
jgi:hypothetical protein